MSLFRTSKHAFPGIALILIALSLFNVRCDDDTIITPFSDREAYFSIFGLITTSDTQLIRVIPIRNSLERDATATSLDATVQTTRLSDGVVEVWQQVLPLLENGDRGLVFSDSTFGHVFQASFTPFVGETYRLDVIRHDGKMTSAQVTIPDVAPPIISDVFFRNDTTFQSVTWPSLTSSPRSIETVYRVDSQLFDPEIQLPAIPISYTQQGYLAPGGWTVDLDLKTDVAYVRQFVADNFSDFSPLPSVEDVDTFEMGSADIRMRVVVGDSLGHTQVTAANLGTISQPGAISNVENGFGFVAALGTNTRLWELPLDLELRQSIGFSY